MQMELIKETVKSVFENLAAKQKEISSANPEELLKKILTKEEFRHIRIKYFKKGVLCLHTDSSSWLYFFNLHKNDILAGLQKSAPEIKGVRFYLGEIK